MNGGRGLRRVTMRCLQTILPYDWKGASVLNSTCALTEHVDEVPVGGAGRLEAALVVLVLLVVRVAVVVVAVLLGAAAAAAVCVFIACVFCFCCNIRLYLEVYTWSTASIKQDIPRTH